PVTRGVTDARTPSATRWRRRFFFRGRSPTDYVAVRPRLGGVWLVAAFRLGVMKLVTYASDRGPRAGVPTDSGVVDAWDLLGGEGTGLKELIGGERLDDLRSALEGGAGEALQVNPDGILAP